MGTQTPNEALRLTKGAVEVVRTLVLTDVVDSTALTSAWGDETMAIVWSAHDRMARELMRVWRGREIDRTDGFLLLFEEVADGVAFANDYHRGLAALPRPLQARTGIHVGPIWLQANPPEDIALGAKPLEIEGLAKPVAARIMAVAQGRQTLMSEQAREALGETKHKLRSHGHWRLKGAADPIELFEIGDDTTAFLPPPDGEKAYRVVRKYDDWLPVRDVPHNLLPERDAFVGREADLRALADRLHDDDGRLVTVHGPGGIGKTRLAHRYAVAWLGDWPGGVMFCDLSEARDLQGLHYAVAVALSVPLGKDDPVLQLGHAIACRGRCLLILDNFEQVQAHAEATLGRWLDRAPLARFVVTSRERLQLRGEQVLALAPLDAQGDGMRLFEVRARAQRSDFAIVDANREQVAQIVRLLDGLPLAVELAAARVRVLSTAQILDRMKDRFKLLAGAQVMASRQATLKAAIDWSWDLLTPWEQAALAQCSVFDGGFTVDAAEAVLDLAPWSDAPPALDVIQSLADKSLLRTSWPLRSDTRNDIADPFFGMYVSIHEYAALRLCGFGETAVREAERRHGCWFASRGSDEAAQRLFTHGGQLLRQQLVLELDNLLAGCRRAISRGEPAVAAGCFLAAWVVLELQGSYAPAAELGAQVAALDGLPLQQRARAQMAISHALRTIGRVGAADGLLAQALAAAQQAQDRTAEFGAWRQMAIAAMHAGRIDEADACYANALALNEAQGDRAQHALVLINLANLRMEQGRMAEARAAYEKALALNREVGNRPAEGISLGNLATLLHELGDLDEARRAYDAALAIHREVGNRLQEAISLCNLGILLNLLGQPQLAAEHYRAALRTHREIGNRRGEGVTLQQMGALHQSLRQFDSARECFDQALAIHREVGNLRFEAGVLTNLGAMLVEQKQFQEGRQSLQTAEQLLRQLGDPLNLAVLLSVKGELAFKQGDGALARASLAEARTLAKRLGSAPGSQLGRSIEALRNTIA